MAEYRVSDEGDPRRYYTQIPNMVDDMGLSVYAFRLYAHLKRVAGENGKCYQSTRTMADACKMAMGSVKKAKIELAKAGLINIITVKGEHGEFSSHDIYITDIWAKNMAQYSTCSPREQVHSPDEQDRSRSDTGAYHTVNRTVSPRELKNNPIKNNQVKKNEATPATVRFSDDYSEAFYLYNQVTGFTAFTGSSTAELREKLNGIVKGFGNMSDAVSWCKDAYAKSLKRRTKDGRPYSKTNVAWVDWAVAREIPPEAPTVGANGKPAQDEGWKSKYSGPNA